MKLTNKKGYTLVLVIGVVALVASFAVLKTCIIITQANASEELAKPEMKTEEKTIEQSVETAEINALLMKADAYMKEVEVIINYGRGHVTHPAIYKTLKSIYTQNQAMIEQNKVIIELLREKTGK